MRFLALGLGFLFLAAVCGAQEDAGRERAEDEERVPGRRQREEEHEREGEGSRARAQDEGAHAIETMARDLMRRIPPEQREAFETFIREQFPREIEELTHLARRRLDAARDELPRLFERMRGLFALYQENPDGFAAERRMHALEEQCEFLAKRYRQAGEGDQAALLPELERAVAELFERRLERLRAEAAEAEEHAARLKDLAAKREEHRTELIEQRLKRLTGELEYQDW
ncbi:MAG: hypothetical protein JXR77_19470 [Lentisphaeria bacterium]|nr:hypothetical protein [Lentisphaeria bacterium]